MRKLLYPALALMAAAMAAPLSAAVEYSVPVGVGAPAANQGSAFRFVSPQLVQAENAALSSFGPFIVLDETTAALVDITDSDAPRQFAAMLAAYPALAKLRFIEAPGTFDDRANLQLGRMIRKAGLATEVPAGGSVRSGAVELFLAGTQLTVDDRAEFAVHAWLDDYGLSANDYAADSPEHRKYLTYYQDMGLSAELAGRFYAMTNSVAFDDALWLTGVQMRAWVSSPPTFDANAAVMVDGDLTASMPKLAYLDLGSVLN